MEYGQIVKFNGVLGRAVKEDDKFYFLPALKTGNYSYSQLDRITDETIEPITLGSKVLCIEQEFNWGPILKTHVIGEYQIIEYMDKDDTIRFHPYLNFKSSHAAYTSLDTALIGIIAANNLEVNEARYATNCILRILKKPEW